MMIEHNRQRFLYGIAETGYKKQGDQYVKIPFPELPWYRKKVRREGGTPAKVPAKYQPDGVVVDLSQYASTGRVETYEIPRTESTQDDAGRDS